MAAAKEVSMEIEEQKYIGPGLSEAPLIGSRDKN